MVSGGVAGLLIGWLLGVFRLVEPLVSVALLGVWGLVVGAVIGAGVGLVAHALSGGRHDFFSTLTLRAERYDLIAAPRSPSTPGCAARPNTRGVTERSDSAVPDDIIPGPPTGLVSRTRCEPSTPTTP